MEMCNVFKKESIDIKTLNTFIMTDNFKNKIKNTSEEKNHKNVNNFI